MGAKRMTSAVMSKEAVNQAAWVLMVSHGDPGPSDQGRLPGVNTLNLLNTGFALKSKDTNPQVHHLTQSALGKAWATVDPCTP